MATRRGWRKIVPAEVASYQVVLVALVGIALITLNEIKFKKAR